MPDFHCQRSFEERKGRREEARGAVLSAGGVLVPAHCPRPLPPRCAYPVLPKPGFLFSAPLGESPNLLGLCVFLGKGL